MNKLINMRPRKNEMKKKKRGTLTCMNKLTCGRERMRCKVNLFLR